MPSAAYQLFEQAMRARRRLVCTYQGLVRVVCPVVLGHSQGLEKVLTFQVGGESRSGLPAGGEWRCLWVAKVERPRVEDGAWIAGESHTLPQGCVEVVDLDVNPDSPFNPTRRI